MAAAITGFTHVLRAVLVVSVRQLSVGLMVAGRNNVAHDDVGGLQEIWAVLIERKQGGRGWRTVSSIIDIRKGVLGIRFLVIAYTRIRCAWDGGHSLPGGF